MKSHLSPRQLASATGISESSFKRWTDEGVLPASRTAGGHRRIALADAVQFIRSRGLEATDTGVLGLGAVRGGNVPESLEEASASLLDLLTGDHVGEAGALVEALFLRGHSIAALADGPIRHALTCIGETWRHDAAGIVIEHRAMDACLATVGRLRALLPRARRGAPVAVGGAPTGDPYLLPSLLAGAVLAEAGFREFNLGPETPAEALDVAAARYRPRLLWRAYTAQTLTTRQIRADLQAVMALAAATSADFVAGGQRLAEVAPHVGAPLHLPGSMVELEAFARGMLAEARRERHH